MRKLNELPLIETIFDAEKKHGIKTHMVIEAVPKTETEPENPTENDVVWWVEFENLAKTFENFDDVKHFLLEEAIATGEDSEVEIEK